MTEPTDAELEALAVEHEAFGFGLADKQGLSTHGFDPDGLRSFARAIEAKARRDALEEAAAAVEKATYRKRWAKAAVNGQARNVPPCELAAAIRALKAEPPPTA